MPLAAVKDILYTRDMTSPNMPAPPNAPQDQAVRQTMDALERKGQKWPSRRVKCRYALDRDKATRQERYITFTAELQTRNAEVFDGIEVNVVEIEQIIRVHDVVIPEAPMEVKAAGDIEAKCWHRDRYIELLRAVVGRERIPPGVEQVGDVKAAGKK
jgi:hypothetical protein